jgi:hypothetical protein
MSDDHPRFLDPNRADVAAQSYTFDGVVKATKEEPAGMSIADLVRDDEADPETEPEYLGPIRPATGSVPAIESSRHLATQTEYPWRTAILHGGSTTIASLVAVASILGDERVQNFINTYVPGQAAGVIGFGIFCGLLAGTLSRIANLPAVAALRTKIGLGPIAKKNLR